MKAALLVVLSLLGVALTLRSAWKQFLVLRARPSHSGWDWALNYPLSALWYLYLLVFSAGLSLNNLVFR